MLTKGIDESIHRGIIYLHQHQFPNGEFCNYIGSKDDLKECVPHSHVFPTSLICFSLLQMKKIPEVKQMLQLSSAFLQFQSMRAGVWNQLTNWSNGFSVYPCDVDNTSCASIVLKALDKEYPDNKEILFDNRAKNGLFYTWYTLRFNKILKKDYWLIILRGFRNPFGAYRYWTTNEATRHDIDGVVNANVLYYLGLRAETQPIIPYIISIIEKNEEAECDLWYRNPLIVYYFFARNYYNGIYGLEPIKDPIIQRILLKVNQNGSIGESALETAMAIISLISLGNKSDIIKKAASYLINTQNTYGEWPRWAIYYDGPSKKQVCGSEEITTAFCLESLAMYKSAFFNDKI